MQTETIDLVREFPFLKRYNSRAVLQVYLRGRYAEFNGTSRYPGLLICPGGGYEYTSQREAEPVALEFLARGYQCFVLRYSCRYVCAPDGPDCRPETLEEREVHFPVQLLEAACAMRLIRSRAADFAVQPDRVAAMGFSAGGHLAAMLGTMWDAPEIRETLGDAGGLRPDALCLGYPVIDSGTFAHAGTLACLLGKDPDPALARRMALQQAVRPDMMPTFLWHTAADQSVPVQNSLLFAQALAGAGVPFSLHIFPNGAHGLSLASALSALEQDPASRMDPQAAQWPALFDQWMQAL